MITLGLQVRHSNMKGNARQPQFPVSSFSLYEGGRPHYNGVDFFIDKKMGLN